MVVSNKTKDNSILHTSTDPKSSKDCYDFIGDVDLILVVDGTDPHYDITMGDVCVNELIGNTLYSGGWAELILSGDIRVTVKGKLSFKSISHTVSGKIDVICKSVVHITEKNEWITERIVTSKKYEVRFNGKSIQQQLGDTLRRHANFNVDVKYFLGNFKLRIQKI